MDRTRYQQYLTQYITAAIRESDGSSRGIAEYLATLQVKGRFVVHREERQRALADAQEAFDEHRHWPLEITLRHLGVTPE